MKSKQISESRKKAIAYRILNKDIKGICASTLVQFRLFQSADILHFSNISKGISNYALLDFDKMVAEYEKIKNKKVIKFLVRQEFKPYFKPVDVYFYSIHVFEEVLNYFGDDYKRFNVKYSNIYDYSRYSLALRGVKCEIKNIEDYDLIDDAEKEKLILERDLEEKRLIKVECCKQRKRIENNKVINVSKIESGIVKKETCYLYSVEDMEYLDKHFSKK